MAFYKYYAGITSQIGFCATPLRLDSYNRCQFGCTYCFASTRQGYGRDSILQISNPESLRKRFERVFSGKISSALDEFIDKKIPFQLGGMSDPFSKIEEKKQVTLQYLKILKEFDYPVILSTKSDLVSGDEYLDVLSDSNSYVRFSTTVVDAEYRSLIDRGCPDLEKISETAKAIINIGVPVSFRLQPILPGHESHAKELIQLASNIGVKHISAEYLKVPIDANKKFGRALKKLLAGNPITTYRNYGAIKMGREYILPLSYRASHLIEMAIAVRNSEMTFGFADNDLLVHADGDSCCNAANLYLRDANYFKANIISLAKNKRLNEKIFFSDYLSSWIPKQAVSTYLNSKARINILSDEGPDWLHYLKKMWRGEHGVYSPIYFDGIECAGEIDDYGLPIYIRGVSNFEKLYLNTLSEKTRLLFSVA